MTRYSSRVRVELPELGVGIGRVTDDAIFVHVNNRLHFMNVDAIGVVSVVALPTLPGAAEADWQPPIRYRMLLEAAAGTQVAPTWAEAKDAIRIVSPSGLARQRSTKSVSAPRGNYTNARRARGLHHDDRFAVERSLWDGADGVLFVQLTGPAFDDRYRDDIAKRIHALLQLANAERCVVPRRAIAREPIGPQKTYCFALASCQYTAGIIDGTPRLDEMLAAPGPADKSFARLAQRLRSPDAEARPELLIMAGDSVYVDATSGLFDPSIADGRYVSPYERLLSSVYVQAITRQIPICAVLDDHELEDNWEDEGDERAKLALSLGKQSYLQYLYTGSVLDNREDLGARDALWSSFQSGGYDFFVVDTRTDREKRTAANIADKHLIKQEQREALEAWLLAGKGSYLPRFVVSSSVLLPRRLSSLEPVGALLSDAWDGYPASQAWLLDVMAKHQIHNVIFLSGDEHLSVTATATSREQGAIEIRSVHSSGMYTPFPFANSIPEDFVDRETFTTHPSASDADTKPTSWQVTSKFAPRGQGFAVISVKHDVEREESTVTVRFDLGLPASPEPHCVFTLRRG